MGKNNYHHWANLNDDGEKKLGHIFPDGVVPVKCMIVSRATFENKNGVHEIFKIDWNELTEEQKIHCVEYLHQKHHVHDDVIRKDIERIGYVPLQSKYTCGSGTDQIQLFI